MLDIADIQNDSMGHDRFQCSTTSGNFTSGPAPAHSRHAASASQPSRSGSPLGITDSDFEMDNACDEVLKRIGRNLLLFQKAEQLMKCLLTMGSPDAMEGIEAPGAIWQDQLLERLKKQLTVRSHAGARQRRESIDLLAREQTHFVHDFLPGLMPGTLANFRALATELDDQRERILPEILRLRDDTESLEKHFLELLAFPHADQPLKQLFPAGRR